MTVNINRQMLDTLEAVITAKGGTVPARGGRHWNDYFLALLEDIITTDGGTVPNLGGASWNHRAIRLMEEVQANTGGGGGSTLTAASFNLDDFTEYDPNSIGQSTAIELDGDSSAPGNIRFNLDGAANATATDLITGGLMLHGSLIELTGGTISTLRITPNDLLKGMLLALDLPSSAYTDLRAFLWAYDDGTAGGGAAPTTSMKGAGGGFLYNATDDAWEPFAASCAGSGTVAEEAATFNRTSPDADGVLWEVMAGRASSRGYIQATAMHADGSRCTEDSGTPTDITNFSGPDTRYNSMAMGVQYNAQDASGSSLSIGLHGAILAHALKVGQVGSR